MEDYYEEDLEIDVVVRANSYSPTLSKLRRIYEIDLSEDNKRGDCYRIMGQEDCLEYLLKIDLVAPL